MNYLSTLEFRSTAVPEVVFHLRKMSHARRIDLNRRTAAVSLRIGEIESQMRNVQEEIERATAAAKIEPCSCNHQETVVPEGIPLDILDDSKHSKETGRCPHPGCTCREPRIDPTIGGYDKLMDLQTQRSTIVIDELYPEYIRWGTQSVEGLEVDGKPATVDLLLERVAETLISELGREIHRIIKMPAADVLGFKSPSTSRAPTDGPTNDTSAPSVSA